MITFIRPLSLQRPPLHIVIIVPNILSKQLGQLKNTTLLRSLSLYETSFFVDTIGCSVANHISLRTWYILVQTKQMTLVKCGPKHGRWH